MNCSKHPGGSSNDILSRGEISQVSIKWSNLRSAYSEHLSLLERKKKILTMRTTTNPSIVCDNYKFSAKHGKLGVLCFKRSQFGINVTTKLWDTYGTVDFISNHSSLTYLRFFFPCVVSGVRFPPPLGYHFEFCPSQPLAPFLLGFLLTCLHQWLCYSSCNLPSHVFNLHGEPQPSWNFSCPSLLQVPYRQFSDP